MSKKREVCAMNGCNNSVECPQSGLCKACYAFAYYWKNKSVTHIMRRVANLKRADDRMQTIIPATVTHIKKSRRKA